MSETVAQDVDIPVKLKGKPAQVDAYRAIATADDPIRPAEISEETGRSIDSTNRAVGKLKDAGHIEKVDHGLYTLPKDSDTEGQFNTTPTVDPGEGDELTSMLESTAVMEIHTEAKVSAGDGHVVYPSESTREVEVPKSFLAEVIGFHPPSRIGVTWAEGDSMKPTIRDGELVIWEPLEDGISSSGIYVLYLAHGTVVKRVQPFPDGSYRIISDNDYDSYQDVTLIPSDDGDHLIQESTGRIAEMHPVGRVLFPDRSTDQMHVKQVSEIIRRLVGGDEQAARALK
jgi:phage repressor protein C with HTH and peptisase S24 domain